MRHTTIASARLCPEIRLRLVTANSRLWRATEEEARASGLVDPFWAFSWTGGQALARFVLDRPELVAGRFVLDFGAGGAVEGIAAARCGARVVASDIDPAAIEAAQLNAELNGVAMETTTENLVGHDEGWDVVLAGDVFYDSALASAALSWFQALAARGALVLVGDPDRGFLNTSSLERLSSYDAHADDDGSFSKPTAIYRVPAAPRP